MPLTAARAGVQLLVFELDEVRYAIELASVREVLRAVLVAPIAGAPPVVEGLVNVRGTLVPVYDLRLRFGHAPRRLHPDDRLVTAWTGERLVGIRCDRADRIDVVATVDVQGGEELQHFGHLISGVARLPDGIVLIHDLSTFLDEAERATLDEAIAGVSAATG